MSPHASLPAGSGTFAPSKERGDGGVGANENVGRGRQTRRLALKFFLRWLMTAIICGCFAGAVAGFMAKAFQLTSDKHNFNAVTSGLIICLSLNLNSSLNAFARAWKWRLLSHRAHAPDTFRHLLAFDTSQLNSLRLLIGAQTSLWLRMLCVLWLVINIGAQIGTAALGLTYSMDSQVRGSVIPSTMGKATAALFTTIRNQGELNGNVEPPGTPGNLTAQRAFAYAYGIGAVNEGFDAFVPSRMPNLGSVAFDSTNNRYVKNLTDYSPWQPPDYQNTLDNSFFVISDRYVTNTATCAEVPILNAQSGFGLTQISFDGPSGAQNFSFQHGTDAVVAYISDAEGSCGPRCTQVYGFLTVDIDKQTLFTCNSTVSPILSGEDDQPVPRPELQLPDAQARILAGGVGWGGIQVSATLKGKDLGLDRFQAATYGNVSAFGPLIQGIDSTSFAIGYVALFPAIILDVMDTSGPRVEFDNIATRVDASDLHVRWELIKLILGLIVGIQGLLAIVLVTAMHFFRVTIHDDDPLAIATMLAPQVAHLPAGSSQSGKEIAKTIGGELRVAKDREGHNVTVVQTNAFGGTETTASATGTSYRTTATATPTAVARPIRASYPAKEGIGADTIGVPHSHHSMRWS